MFPSTKCYVLYCLLLYLAAIGDGFRGNGGQRVSSVFTPLFCADSKMNTRIENDVHMLPSSERSRVARVVSTTSSTFLTTLAATTAIHRPSMAMDEDSKSLNSSATDLTITDKVFFDIKIANYTEESTGRNRGARGSGKIIVGLFGNAAPESVKRFLATIDGDGETAPNFYNAQFSRIVDDNLLLIEKIPGISALKIAGTDQYEYKGNVLTDYTPILETNGISHNKAGYLTRRQLTVGPEFGITVGSNATSLDGFHLVFGTILQGMEVIEAITRVDRYSYMTKTGYTGLKPKGQTKSTDDLADKWFEAQREFYGKF